jgi:hypothetical protein
MIFSVARRPGRIKIRPAGSSFFGFNKDENAVPRELLHFPD